MESTALIMTLGELVTEVRRLADATFKLQQQQAKQMEYTQELIENLPEILKNLQEELQ